MRTKDSSQKARSSLEVTRANRRARVVRSNIGSNNIKTHKNSTPYAKIRFISPLVIVVLAALIFLTGYTSGVEIKTTPSQGASDTITAQAEGTANQYFSGLQRWWWFVSKEKAAAEIEKTNPYIKQAQIKRAFITRKIVVSISTRDPAIRLRADKRQYLMATDGVILEESDKDNKNIPLVYDESSGITDIEDGTGYLPSQTVKTITQINNLLGKNKVQAKEYSLTDNTREIRVYIKGEKYFLKLTTDANVAAQIGDYMRVKPKVKTNTDYIDVRFNGKVYVKP